jgi:hypothetical protein
VVAESHDVGVQIGADRDPTRNKDLLQRINELRPIRPAIKVIMGCYFPGKGKVAWPQHRRLWNNSCRWERKGRYR